MSSRRASAESEIRLPVKFRECLCVHEQAGDNDYERLVWRHGATFQTRLIAPFIRWVWPDYFQAEDDCVSAMADSRWRNDVRDELLMLHTGMRRRSWLRFFGIGLSGWRVMRLFDFLAQVYGTARSELHSGATVSRPGRNQS